VPHPSVWLAARQGVTMLARMTGARMNNTLRVVAPMVYAALVVGGYLVNSKMGTTIAVVGAMLLAALYVATTRRSA